MEGFYSNNNPIQKITASTNNASSIDPKKDHQFISSRARFPLTNLSLGSYTASDFQEMDPRLIRYSHAVAASGILQSTGDMFQSPAIDTSKFHPMLLHQYHSNFSSLSPLSAVEKLDTPSSGSPPVFTTPVKVEEDVLVMDGILVGSQPGGRTRSASDSGSSSSGNSLYKTEICRSWEDSGSCRYGSKCQFAHGKEELRPSRYSNKNKSEGGWQICKSFTAGTCTYSKCRFVHQIPAPPMATETVSSTKPEQEIRSILIPDWSPEDDGIVVTEGSPARRDVDAHIHEVLYGPRRGRRLPVFAEICPD
ncbi:hypothetical protein HHK36_009368 [Tetracentron sinense]|uniref:C3H1-type domain-containing protein n=1 Tax=Tetracentron sinense TaxID=13715 RepID=A0A834ZG53_TETSI|nr:hypothetical protein HHK36_009368 [Tetracentron sinense]